MEVDSPENIYELFGIPENMFPIAVKRSEVDLFKAANPSAREGNLAIGWSPELDKHIKCRPLGQFFGPPDHNKPNE